MNDTQSAFDSNFLKKLEYLYIVSKKIFAGRIKASVAVPGAVSVSNLLITETIPPATIFATLIGTLSHAWTSSS